MAKSEEIQYFAKMFQIVNYVNCVSGHFSYYLLMHVGIMCIVLSSIYIRMYIGIHTVAFVWIRACYVW